MEMSPRYLGCWSALPRSWVLLVNSSGRLWRASFAELRLGVEPDLDAECCLGNKVEFDWLMHCEIRVGAALLLRRKLVMAKSSRDE